MKQYKHNYKIDDLSKKTPFRVKDGYFEKLPYQIQEKVYQKQKQVFWKTNIFRWTSIGLSLGLLLIGFFTFKPTTQSSFDFEQQMELVSTEQIQEYLHIYDALDYEENEIIELVIENKYEPKIDEYMAFSDEDIETYIDENYLIEDIEILEYEDYETTID